MEYLLLLFSLVAIAYSFKIYHELKRAVCFHLWKRNRDRLTIEQYIQGFESEYYKALMKDLYK